MTVVDTHVVLWLALEPDKISRTARLAIEEARHTAQGLAISDITLFEIAMIVSKGRVKLDTDLETFLSEVEQRFVVLPITGKICARALDLPDSYSKDPSDRIIGATTLVAADHLVTADHEIRRSKAVRTIW